MTFAPCIVLSAGDMLRTRITACEQMMGVFPPDSTVHIHAKEVRDQARRELADLYSADAGLLTADDVDDADIFIGSEPQLPEAA